ncbi:hypothetical protein [Nannocystis radixulma]|uniref:Uncharacterized protein n=1 Tax=Nannocystis radixulma TaxID=2995305 RepID=A0ABT5BAK4_9BACT|nr:hypothetical protein [Nannocystis radixulma]MDC0671160.1 hypothetical protein [Nannocystis radixulma]
MLRAALHVLVSGSMIAGPPTAREYSGDDAVIVAPGPGGSSAPTIPEPPAETPPLPEPPAEAPTESGAETLSGTPTTQPATATPEPAQQESAPAPTQPEGPVEEDEAEEVAYDPLIDSPEAQRARSWVRSGAVFLGIGGALTIGAIAMSQAKVNTLEDQDACDPRKDLAGNGCLEGARNRAVAALAVPGALLLIGGIAMLTAGKVQQKRLRANLRASRREVLIGLQWTF